MYKNIRAYNIIKICGQGTYGSVYIAENTLSLQKVALKVLHGKQQKRELEGLIKYREIRHKNLLQIYHVDRTEDGQLYYTMELADNANTSAEDYVADTFAYRLKRDGRIDSDALKKIILELLDGLEKIHKAKLLHRDIKPDNILFINNHAVLADIGLTTTLTEAKALGTPQFMPKNGISRYNDIYALSMVCYCGLTNLPPADFPRVPKDLQGAKDLIKICTKVCSKETSLNEFRTLLNEPPKIKKSYITWFIISIIISILILCINMIFSVKKEEKIASLQLKELSLLTSTKLSREEYFTNIEKLKQKYNFSDNFKKKLRQKFQNLESKKNKLWSKMKETNELNHKTNRYLEITQQQFHLSQLFGDIALLESNIKNGEKYPSKQMLDQIEKMLIALMQYFEKNCDSF